MLYVSMTNLTTVPREVIVDARVKGDGIKFGPLPNLSMAEITEQRIHLPSGKAVEIGFPFSVAKDYVNGSAAFEVSSGGRSIGTGRAARSVSISLPVRLGSYPVFRVFS
jgi:hypothetical protein